MGNSVIGILEIDPAHTQSSKSLEAGISDNHFVNCQTVHAASGPLPQSTLLLRKQVISFNVSCKAVGQHHCGKLVLGVPTCNRPVVTWVHCSPFLGIRMVLPITNQSGKGIAVFNITSVTKSSACPASRNTFHQKLTMPLAQGLTRTWLSSGVSKIRPHQGKVYLLFQIT